TTLLTRNIFLPYTQLGVAEILADQPTKVMVVNRPGYNNTGASGVLFFKTETESQYTEVSMSQAGDSLWANIPAIGSVEEVTFYTVISDTIRNNSYRSSESSIIPLASGILSSIRLTPTINGQTLRAGDTYNLELFVRD